MKKIIAVILITVCTLGIGHAQAPTPATNAPMANPIPADGTPTTDQKVADIAKVFQDFGVHVNVTSLGSGLFLIYLVAKFARNKTPLGNGPVGKILSSIINLESSTKPPGS